MRSRQVGALCALDLAGDEVGVEMGEVDVLDRVAARLGVGVIDHDVIAERGKIPRHAKVYADFATEYDRLQEMRIAAMGRYVADVHGGDYPAPQYLVDSENEVVEAFRDWLDQVA